MFWSIGVGNQLTTSNISEQNHKLYCGAHLETTNPSRIVCGKKAQAGNLEDFRTV